MTDETMSHDGLPDSVAPERLLAKKIKDNTATPEEALAWLHETQRARANSIGIRAVEIIRRTLQPSSANH